MSTLAPSQMFRVAVTSGGQSTADPLVQDGTLQARANELLAASHQPGELGVEASRAAKSLAALAAVHPMQLALFENQVFGTPAGQKLASNSANLAAMRDHLRAQLVGVSPAQHAKTVTMMAESALASGDVRAFAQLCQALQALGAAEELRASYSAQLKTMPQYQKTQLGVTPLDESLFSASKGFVAIGAPRVASALIETIQGQQARLAGMSASMPESDPRKATLVSAHQFLGQHATYLSDMLQQLPPDPPSASLGAVLDQATDSAVYCSQALAQIDTILSPSPAPSLEHGALDLLRFDHASRSTTYTDRLRRYEAHRRFEDESGSGDHWKDATDKARVERDTYDRDQARYEAERQRIVADQARRDAERMSYERDMQRRDADRWAERRAQERYDQERWNRR